MGPISMTRNENKYTFKDNKAFVNQLALKFNSFFKLLDAGQEIDISFKNKRPLSEISLLCCLKPTRKTLKMSKLQDLLLLKAGRKV